jgi:DNA-binding NarL/FixJ family response regulator
VTTSRVLLADDQALLHHGLQMMVDAQPDLQVVGQAADGAEAVELAARLSPDVVLMDIRMPRMDGVEATRRICGSAGSVGGPKVIVLTTFDLDEYVVGALSAGASGFLLKDAPPADIIAGIRVVAAGDALLAPSVTRRLLDRFATRPEITNMASPAGLDLLTDREREVAPAPSYTGGLVAFLGAGIALDSWLSILALVFIPLLAVLVRIYLEEAELATALGPEFTRYASRTHRLVPGLW